VTAAWKQENAVHLTEHENEKAALAGAEPGR
jgi:hypothetical protein